MNSSSSDWVETENKLYQNDKMFIEQGSRVYLIFLNPPEFLNLFSRPGNSLNLAVFVIMSLNSLENMRSIGRSSNLLS